LVHLVKKKKLSSNHSIKIKSPSFKSLKKLHSELLLASKKRLNIKKLAILNKLTSLRFTNILGNFKNLERYKVSKNNFFSFYFNLSSVLTLPLNKFCQLTLNIFIVQSLFYLTRTGTKSLQNTLLSPGGKLDYVKFQTLQNPFGILFNPIVIERIIERALESDFFTESDIFFKNKVNLALNTNSTTLAQLGFLHLTNWYLILLHKQYVYRTTKGRMLGVYVPARNVFHHQKAFFSNTLFPYGFTTILRNGSHMSSDFFKRTSSFSHTRLMSLPTSFTNYTQYNFRFSFYNKYIMFTLNSFFVNNSHLFLYAWKVKKRRF
jgi:hypothetical protein